MESEEPVSEWQSPKTLWICWAVRFRLKAKLEEDRKKAIKAGMNAHIAKPISADIILENLEKMR